MAEVYWDLEWTLQQQGFDYAYDKRLYDRLREQHARPVREHFHAGLDYQNKLARFLENHDEPRAASTFPPEVHQAAAVITFLSPGLRFFHQGQFDGRKKRISPHLDRAPDEPVDPAIRQFYDNLLTIMRQPVVRDGQWQLLECAPAWDGNWTNDCFVAFGWQGADGEQLARGGELRPEPEPVSPPPAVPWSGRQILAIARPDQLRQLMSAMAMNSNPRDYSSIYDPGRRPSLRSEAQPAARILRCETRNGNTTALRKIGLSR